MNEGGNTGRRPTRVPRLGGVSDLILQVERLSVEGGGGGGGGGQGERSIDWRMCVSRIPTSFPTLSFPFITHSPKGVGERGGGGWGGSLRRRRCHTIEVCLPRGLWVIVFNWQLLFPSNSLCIFPYVPLQLLVCSAWKQKMLKRFIINSVYYLIVLAALYRGYNVF